MSLSGSLPGATEIEALRAAVCARLETLMTLLDGEPVRRLPEDVANLAGASPLRGLAGNTECDAIDYGRVAILAEAAGAREIADELIRRGVEHQKAHIALLEEGVDDEWGRWTGSAQYVRACGSSRRGDDAYMSTHPRGQQRAGAAWVLAWLEGLSDYSRRVEAAQARRSLTDDVRGRGSRGSVASAMSAVFDDVAQTGDLEGLARACEALNCTDAARVARDPVMDDLVRRRIRARAVAEIGSPHDIARLTPETDLRLLDDTRWADATIPAAALARADGLARRHVYLPVRVRANVATPGRITHQIILPDRDRGLADQTSPGTVLGRVALGVELAEVAAPLAVEVRTLVAPETFLPVRAEVARRLGHEPAVVVTDGVDDEHNGLELLAHCRYRVDVGGGVALVHHLYATLNRRERDADAGSHAEDLLHDTPFTALDIRNEEPDASGYSWSLLDVRGRGEDGDDEVAVPVEDLGAVDRVVFLGDGSCTHPDGYTHRNGKKPGEQGDAILVGCHACGRERLAVVPFHRAPADLRTTLIVGLDEIEDDPVKATLSGMLDARMYMARERAHAALEGRPDPGDDLAALIAREGEMSVDARDYPSPKGAP